MANQQTMQGSWNEIAGKIREKWGQLTDDELSQFKGNIAQLAGYIQRKTGTTREEVDKFLNEATAEGSAAISRVAETAKEYATQAAGAVRENAERMTEGVREGYASAEKMVQQRPGESVAAAFGAGLIAGVVLTLLFRSR